MGFNAIPEKKAWLLVIIVLAALNPLHYIILRYNSPPDLIFSGYTGDDSVFFTTMESAKWGFTSPWSLTNETIFANPAFGPLYILIPLGIISIATGISTFWIFLAFKFLSGIFFMLVAYHFIKQFSKNHNKAYFLFALTAGFGGIVVLAIKLSTASGLFVPTAWYAFGISAMRMLGNYQVLPLATGLITILWFFQKQRSLKTGILLGITFLFYPFYGAATATVLLVLILTNRSMGTKNFLKTMIISVPFVAVWGIPYFLAAGNVVSYAAAGQNISEIFLPTLILGWGPAFLAGCYWIYKESPKLRRSIKIKIVIWAISIILFSFANISRSFWATADSFAQSVLASLGLLQLAEYIRPAALLLEIPLFIMIVLATINVYRDLKSSRQKFIFLWLVVFALLVMAPGELVYQAGGKMHNFIWIPIAILGAEGVVEISRRTRRRYSHILLAVFLVSLPTLFFMNAFAQTYPRAQIESFDTEQCCFFYTAHEHAAFDFLSGKPRGMVLASVETGTWLPVHSGQKTLLHQYTQNFVSGAGEKHSDFEKFFSPGTSSTLRKEILGKYDVSYVFLGPSERIYGLTEISDVFLEIAYENDGVLVYQVMK